MFRLIDLPTHNFIPFSEIIDPGLYLDVQSAARNLTGSRIVHINSTAVGGGVAEILRSFIPISRGLNIETDWYVISPPQNFFDVTKKIHNLLQGAPGELTKEERDIYMGYGGIAQELDFTMLDADIWILHDPQLLPFLSLVPAGKRPLSIWVCHIDLSNPNKEMLKSVLPFIRLADALIFSMADYVPDSLGDQPVHIIPPAIDPLSVKNQPMNLDSAKRLLHKKGIDPDRPLVTQVSRFDPWKDPWGVIDAYKLAKQSASDLQLAYLGASHASDDPEGKSIFDSITLYAGSDPDIHLYTDQHIPLTEVDESVNAFQTASDIILQKSIREGFGLTVTEAMWKGRPVIGGNVGGIRTQIENDRTGFLVDNIEQCAERIASIIQTPALGQTLGKAAKESVRRRFLMPRLIDDYLRVIIGHTPLPGSQTGSAPKEI